MLLFRQAGRFWTLRGFNWTASQAEKRRHINQLRCFINIRTQLLQEVQGRNSKNIQLLYQALAESSKQTGGQSSSCPRNPSWAGSYNRSSMRLHVQSNPIVIEIHVASYQKYSSTYTLFSLIGCEKLSKCLVQHPPSLLHFSAWCGGWLLLSLGWSKRIAVGG